MKLPQTIIGFLIAFVITAPFTSPAAAQTASPDPATTTSAELRRAIRERIEETLKDKDSSTQSFRGFIGTITQVGTATFGLTTPYGEEKTIQISPTTAIVSDGKDMKLSELIIGNGIAVIGTPVDELVISARRVLMSDDNYTETRQVSIGAITEIGRQELTLEIRGQQQQVAWPTTTRTAYEDMDGQKIQRTTLEEDQAALVITDLDTADKRYIKRVRLLVPISE
jgi:hypothetical protein